MATAFLNSYGKKTRAGNEKTGSRVCRTCPTSPICPTKFAETRTILLQKSPVISRQDLSPAVSDLSDLSDKVRENLLCHFKLINYFFLPQFPDLYALRKKFCSSRQQTGSVSIFCSCLCCGKVVFARFTQFLISGFAPS